MTTPFDPKKPDINNQTIVDAFLSTQVNISEVDLTLSRDHFPPSEPDDASRGAHKLITFPSTAWLTSHPNTSANEVKIYMYKDPITSNLNFYVREPNGAVPKLVPSFSQDSFIKTINKTLGNSNSDFEISTEQSGEITITAATNGLILGLSAAIKSAIAQVGTNTNDISALKTTTSTHTSQITKLQTDLGITERDVLSLQNITNTHTSDIAKLKTDSATHETEITQLQNKLDTIATTLPDTQQGVQSTQSGSKLGLKLSTNTGNTATIGSDGGLLVTGGGGGTTTITSTDGTVQHSGTTTVDLSIAASVGDGLTVDVTTPTAKKIKAKPSTDANNALRFGTDKGLFVPTGGGTFDPSTLPGVGLTWNATSRTIDANLGKTLETSQASAGGMEVKLSQASGNSLSRLADGLFASSGSGTGAVSSVDGLTGAISTTGGGVVKHTVNGQQITFTVEDAVTAPKTLYWSDSIGSENSAGTAYFPLKSLKNCIDKAAGQLSSQDIVKTKSLDVSGTTSITIPCPGLEIEHASDTTFISSSTEIILPIDKAFVDFVETGGKAPFVSFGMFTSLDKNSTTITVGAINDAAPGPASTEITYSIAIKQLQFIVPIQNSYFIAVRAGQDLPGKFACIRQLNLNVHVETLLELMGASGTALPLIGIDLRDFKTDATHPLTIKINLVVENIIDGANFAIAAKSALIEVTNYDQQVHGNVNIFVDEIKYPRESKFYDTKILDRNVSYPVVTLPVKTLSKDFFLPNPGDLRADTTTPDQPKLELYSGNAWHPISSGSAPVSPTDIETVYFSSTGNDTYAGTAEKPVQSFLQAIINALAKRDGTRISTNPIVVESLPDNATRNLALSSHTADGGGLSFNLPDCNLSSGKLTINVPTTIIDDRSQFDLIINSIDDATIEIDVDTLASKPTSDKTFLVKLHISNLYKKTSQTDPTILVKRGIDGGSPYTGIRTLVLDITVDELIEISPTSTNPVSTTPIIQFDQSNLANMNLSVIINNVSQTTDQVVPTNTITQQKIISKIGTPASTDPCTISANVNIQTANSKLFSPLSSSDAADYAQLSLNTADTALKTRIAALSNLLIPVQSTQTLESVPGSFGVTKNNLGQNVLSYNDGLSQKTVMTREIDSQYFKQSSEESDPAANFFTSITINGLVNTISIPKTEWNGYAANSYQEINKVRTNSFSTPETSDINIRAVPITLSDGTTILPAATRIDQFDFSQGKNFSGIPCMAIPKCTGLKVDSVIIDINDSARNLYIITFTDLTNTVTLADLTPNVWTGSFITFLDPVSKKEIPIVCRDIFRQTGTQFTIKGCISMGPQTGTHVYADASALSAALATARYDLLVSPYPSFSFYTSIIKDNTLAATGQSMRYNLVSAKFGDDRYSLMLIPYSPRHAQDSVINNVRSYASIGLSQWGLHKLPKCIVELLRAKWNVPADGDINLGTVTTGLISYCDGTLTPNRRNFLGCWIKNRGDELYMSYPVSHNNTSSYYRNSFHTFTPGLSMATDKKSVSSSGYRAAIINDDYICSWKMNIRPTDNSINLTSPRIAATSAGDTNSFSVASIYDDTYRGTQTQFGLYLDENTLKLSALIGETATDAIKYAPIKDLLIADMSKAPNANTVFIEPSAYVISNSTYTNTISHKIIFSDQTPNIPPAVQPVSFDDLLTIGFEQNQASDIHLAIVDTNGHTIPPLQ